MEVDMQMFDCEMRFDDLENYIFLNEPCEGANSLFYGDPQVDSGESWHDTLANATNNGDQHFFYTECSPSLSRSSSHVSTGSESSIKSTFDHNTSPGLVGFTSGQMTGLCSPLSELTRSSSSSLQSVDSDELDDSHGLSTRDMVVHSHQSHQIVNDHNMSMGTDLRSLMDSSSLIDSMLGNGVPDLGSALNNHGHYGDWNNSDSQGQSQNLKPELYGSSPVSPFDFDDEAILGRQTSQSFSEHDEISQDIQQHHSSASALANIDDGVQQKFGNGHPQLLSSSNEASSEKKNDFFYQHLASEISFTKVHTPCTDGFRPHLAPHFGITSEEDLNGVRLVHLLLAGAEAVAGSNVDLATVILVRLKELVSRNGSTMQRVAAYFSEGLQYRIEGVKGSERAFEPQNESLSAFQVMHEVSPYIKFGHFTANQAILEAFEGERRVHILDYDILEGIQWPSLMQALACRPGGPPHLRITAVTRPHVKRALAMTQETGKRLTEFAATFNIPFSFHQVRIDNEDEFRPTVLKQVKGECLAVNFMLHLPHMPHRSTKAVASFMKAIHKLSPRVFTLVEEELSCASPTFVNHFFEALHHYSAIFDSLEATLSVESKGRQLVERIFLAPRITNLMTSSCTSEGLLEGTSETNGSIHWHALAQAAGFQSVPLSMYNLCQAKLLLGLFNDGYKVEEENKRLLLSWRSKTLMAASVWHCS